MYVPVYTYFPIYYIPPKHAYIHTCWVLPVRLQSKDLHYVTIPVKDAAERRGETTLRLPFIMPHELVDYLYEALRNLLSVGRGCILD